MIGSGYRYGDNSDDPVAAFFCCLQHLDRLIVLH